jgi:predicted nucleotidyltransferase
MNTLVKTMPSSKNFSSAHCQPLVQHLRSHFPGLLAVYAFGSRIQGLATVDSDLDLAILLPGYADPLSLWTLSSELAELAGCLVDVLDLRAASTVMQDQILTTGIRCWAADDNQADMFEIAMLNEKLALDEARSELLDDIAKRGTIYD